MTVPVPEPQLSDPEFLTERDCTDTLRLGTQLLIIGFPTLIFVYLLFHLSSMPIAGLSNVWMLIYFSWTTRQRIRRGEKIPKRQQKPGSPRANIICTSVLMAAFVLLDLWCSAKLFPALFHPLTHIRDIVHIIGAAYLEIVMSFILLGFIRHLRETIRQERTRLRSAAALVAPIAAVSHSPLEAPVTLQTDTAPIARHWWTESQLRQEILKQGHNER